MAGRNAVFGLCDWVKGEGGVVPGLTRIGRRRDVAESAHAVVLIIGGLMGLVGERCNPAGIVDDGRGGTRIGKLHVLRRAAFPVGEDRGVIVAIGQAVQGAVRVPYLVPDQAPEARAVFGQGRGAVITRAGRSYIVDSSRGALAQHP